MKYFLPLLFVLSLLVSCEDFATAHNLSEEPAGDLVLEILDQSTLFDYSRAVVYGSFTTTDPNWGNYLSSYVGFKAPNWDVNDSKANVSLLADGNLQATVTHKSNLVSQGDYSLYLYAGVDELEETYRYTMNLNIPGTDGAYLSARIDSSNTPRAPYINQGISSYEIAINDDENSLFVLPADSYSAEQFALFYLEKDNYLEYLIFLEPADMENGKWTKIPFTELIEKRTTPETITAADFRDNSTWNVEHYTSTIIQEDWGTLYRSEYRKTTISSDNPSTDILSVFSSSRSLAGGELGNISPLAEKTLNSYSIR